MAEANRVTTMDTAVSTSKSLRSSNKPDDDYDNSHIRQGAEAESEEDAFMCMDGNNSNKGASDSGDDDDDDFVEISDENFETNSDKRVDEQQQQQQPADFQ